ncbi:hypothetical protein M1N61_01475 [Peptococcaceae bacterium]|nr:hypothetical protein [Peptococcaceae bacterium]
MEELIQQCLKNHKKKQIELERIEQYVIEKLRQVFKTKSRFQVTASYYC